uniref:Uncharacterized protein n=1 Tax=Geospiza parvula TaxID=87175 RepID=A0A8U8BWY2_GEOPR
MPSPWVLVLAALAQAVDSYNQQPEVQNAFRLLSAEPEPGPGVELSSLRRFNFSMMETECAASARANPDDCDFKENGVRREEEEEREEGGTGPRCHPQVTPRVPPVRRFRPRIKFDVRVKGSVGLG